MWRWFSLKRIAPGARSTSTPSRSAPHLLDQPNPGILAPRMSSAGLRAARPAGARRPWWIGPDDQTREERMPRGCCGKRRAVFCFLRHGREAYPSPMTKLLDRAVEAARGLPPERQDEIARVVLRLAGAEEPPTALTAEERAAIDAVAGGGRVAANSPRMTKCALCGLDTICEGSLHTCGTCRSKKRHTPPAAAVKRAVMFNALGSRR